MASFVQMSHQGIGGGIRQAKGKRYQVTVLDAEQGATHIRNRPATTVFPS